MKSSFYWKNRHWVEKQKLREDKVREAGRQRETPSEYIIRKMELLSLICSYSNTETIQAIMAEVPKTWASIIDPQYQKTFKEFPNLIKYREEFLEKLEAPVSQPLRLPNQEYSSMHFPY